ncbi:sulfotransferase 1B1 [Dermatophagoides farinae]|uniref:sulfotransferase 1B1 n=1 Tax=Dermatophagoides farinae TaxID=6954 RepID=UPI003F5F9EF0
MKSIRNSIKKLRAPWAFRESIQSNVNEDNNDEDDDIETKRLRYQQLISNLVIYKGYEFPGDAVHKRVLENIEDFDVREDDIFLIAYPANGIHLLEDIVQALLQKHLEKKNIQQQETNNEHHEETKEIVEENPVDQKDIKNHSDQQASQIPVARLEASNLYGHIRWLTSLRSPRIISTSLPYDLLPQQLHIPTAKLIYMGRNSKDHIVAYYYHHRLKGVQISLDDFIDLYLNGNLIYGNYFDHIVSYWQLSQLYPNNVLFICYEELKIITLTIVKLIVKFLNLNLDEKEIEMLIVDKQFIRNTSNTMNGNDDLQRQQEDSDRQHAHKVNKFHNVLGDWDNYLNIDQCRRVDEMIRIKFESQRLYLTDDAEMALNNVEKFGRILCNKPDNKPKSRLLSGIGVTNAMLTMTPTRKSKSTFQKKLILTKDEAQFIRKKDKVIIIENIDDESDSNQNDKQSNWFSRIFCFCCTDSNLLKRRSYNKL